MFYPYRKYTCGIEIYWRSFQNFGNYNYSLRKIARKMTKNAQKILKNCAKIALFFLYIFRFILLKMLRVVDWGYGPSSPPWLRDCFARVITDRINDLESRSEVIQGHRFWYQLKARIHIPIYTTLFTISSKKNNKNEKK